MEAEPHLNGAQEAKGLSTMKARRLSLMVWSCSRGRVAPQRKYVEVPEYSDIKLKEYSTESWPSLEKQAFELVIDDEVYRLVALLRIVRIACG